MKDLILLISLAGMAIFGYCIMSRLDLFLAEIRKETEYQKLPYSLKIATSSLYAVEPIEKILEDTQSKYPSVQCTLSVGQEQDVLQSFSSGNVDVVIVSSAAEISSPSPWEYITFYPQPLRIRGSDVLLQPISAAAQRQKVFWKQNLSHSPAEEFVHQLCSQIA